MVHVANNNNLQLFRRRFHLSVGSTHSWHGSHIPIASEFLERILVLVVLGADVTFRSPGDPQFLDDFADVGGAGLDRESARRAAQAAIPLALAIREVQWNHWNLLALDIFPHIELRPVEQRMDADMGALFEVGLELVPKFRRL